MFEVLVGNKSVERILLFLFVNEKCYGTQLHRVLGVPLTPIQKALSRLEQGGVITSYFEGKNRVYSFNPVYPLLNELEALLKKVYTLLPAQKKREYYVAKQELQERNLAQKNNAKTILEFWERLLKITRLTFHARSKNREGLGWNGKGQGEVVVTKEASNRLIFNEKGSWVGMDGSSTSFSNRLLSMDA